MIRADNMMQLMRTMSVAMAATFVSHAHGETYEVAPGGNIQAAIDLAKDGDVILLQEGIHRPGDRLEIINKSITLGGVSRGTGSPASIIEGQFLHQHLLIDGDGEMETVLENIQFRFGHSYAPRSGNKGGSIRLDNGALVIRSAMFRHNIVSGGNAPSGSAIYCGPGTSLQCVECDFLDNGKCCTQWVSGGAICSMSSTLVLDDCRLEGNFAGNGGAIFTDQSSVTIDRCHLEANGIRMPSTSGGGALLFSRSNLEIRDTDFIGNVGEYGGALSFWDLNDATVTRCRFFGNGSEQCQACRGGAVCLNNGSSTVRLDSCEFADNIASSQDIYAHEAGEQFVFLKDCRFEDCCSIDSPRSIFDLGGNIIDYACSDCPGDIDCRQLWPSHPKQTNSGDLGLLLERWGTRDPICDIDGDGIVGSSDLGILLTSWGPCPN